MSSVKGGGLVSQSDSVALVPPDIHKLLARSASKNACNVAVAERFASKDRKDRKYVLGRNECSAFVISLNNIDAVVDDFIAGPNVTWYGKPVITASEMEESGVVVNCAHGIAPVSAMRRLSGVTKNVLDYTELCWLFPDKYPLPKFVAETRTDLSDHTIEWESLFASLADDESRRVFSDVLSYRASGKCQAMAAYSVRTHLQYFEGFLRLKPGEVFIDAGGFEGETTEEFCRRCPGYSKVYLFEPSDVNLARARHRLKDLRFIVFRGEALSDTKGKLSFDPGSGSASCVSGHGQYEVDATTLDAEVNDKVTFIKMDLEGWELRALIGARGHVATDHPKMAIAVYHSASDFRNVFKWVTSQYAKYQVYLRHYTEGWTETVMYFIPE